MHRVLCICAAAAVLGLATSARGDERNSPEPLPRHPDRVALQLRTMRQVADVQYRPGSQKKTSVEQPGETALPRDLPPRPVTDPAMDAPTLAPLAARDIEVSGRVGYFRPDDEFIGAYEVAVYVYDQDGGDEELLGTDFTDPGGYYSVTFTWDPCVGCESQPDIFLVFIASNSHVDVVPTDAPLSPYAWATATEVNYAGISLDMGTFEPGAEQDYPALHMLTTVVRAWRWFFLQGENTPIVHVRWPDSTANNNSHYSQALQSLFIADEQEWDEDTIIHEYGHHFVHTFGSATSTDYCNGVCDPDNGAACRHCDWCAETGQDAWNEGFADWVADVITRSFEADYGLASSTTREVEFLGPCEESSLNGTNNEAGLGCGCNPDSTEGFLHALVRDIEDEDAGSGGVNPGDDDPRAPGSWRDQISGKADRVLSVATTDPKPDTPREFITQYMAAYTSAADREAFWETAKNAGYEVDTFAPGAVTNLASPSHFVNSPSPDATIDFTWTRATDDAAGNYLYSVSVTVGAAALPDAFSDVSYVTSYTTAPLAPGNAYYFNIRAIDRSGKVSATYAHLGPYMIEAVEPVDLDFVTTLGWYDVLVPHPAADVGGDLIVNAPATLNGNTSGGSGTFWNVIGRNTSATNATSGGFDIYLLVDGLFSRTVRRLAALGPSSSVTFVNQGPIHIRGGRHVLTGILDASEEIHEQSEINNVYGRQWVWSPLVLAAGTKVTRVQPPDRNGGRFDLGGGSAPNFNCDGLRFNTTGYWNAVWIEPSNIDDDYDARLHTASTGVSSGFGGSLATASRPAGCLDAVILNRNVVANGNYDVSVLDFNAVRDPFGTGFDVKFVTQVTINFGDSIDVTMPAGDMLLLREFRVEPGDVGPVSIVVDVDPAEGPLHVLWLDAGFTTGDLLDFSAAAVTGPLGRARIDVNIGAAGYNCVVVYRDPKELPGGAAAAVTFTLEIDKTPPDFTPELVAGWYAPIVPRPAADGTPVLVPPPPVLLGNVAATYFNFAVQNDSPSPASLGMHSRVEVDGVSLPTLTWSSFASGQVRTVNSGIPRTIAGGRHTLFWPLDFDAHFEEIFESNNSYGEQWVWSPLDLVLDVAVTRNPPPARTAGWSGISTAEPRWYNCDGLRTPAFTTSGADGYWGAIAIMPGAASDVDLRLHDVVAGVKNGFAQSLKLSGWGKGQSDFVLMNFHDTPAAAFDVGAVLELGVEPYLAMANSSKRRSWNSVQGPFVMPADRILDLHDFYLPAGTYTVSLTNVAGAVDWGLSFYGSLESYYAKSDAVDNGVVWMNDGGEGETLNVVLPVDGYYCGAVWKSRAADLALAGTYELNVEPVGATAVSQDPTPGPITTLTAVNPNPTPRGASIMWTLTEPENIALAVFDIRGVRVRTLGEGRWTAGEHRVEWDGRDGSGSKVEGGVYFVRLEAGKIRNTRKLIVL